MNSTKIYIIIVTYNAMKWAEKCFSSLRKSSIPVQTIVVDNGSTDGTQNFIKQNFPEVDFLQSSENLGFGKANNLGIEKAYKEGADFFYLMNQDAWIYENSMAEMLKVYEEYPSKDEIGIISPMHLDGSEKKLDLHFENYLGKYARENRMISDIFMKNEKPYYEIDFVNAAHWLLPKKTVESIGGFNSYFFYGAEDYEYVNRVKHFEKKILLAIHSIVVHDTVQAFFKREFKSDKEKTMAERESLRMQRETQMFNPVYPFDIRNEKKRLHSDRIKLFLKGAIDESNFHRDMLRYFSDKFEEIQKCREMALHSKHPFLNL